MNQHSHIVNIVHRMRNVLICPNQDMYINLEALVMCILGCLFWHYI